MTALTDVENVINQYFDTLYYCDLDKFDDVFHLNAIYATADESPTLIRGMIEYKEIIAQRESPASRKELRKDTINSIEFAGSNTARVSAKCSIGSNDFIDFLTLIRDNGQWKIISKVFQIIKSEQ